MCATSQKKSNEVCVHLLHLIKPRLLPILAIALSQPPTRFEQLHHIDILLERHDRQADNAEHPGHGAVHFVGAGHFHGGSGERRGEERGRFGRGGRAGEEGEGFAAIDRQERGCDGGRGEAEEVEGDEEEFVEGAADEEDPLFVERFVRSGVQLKRMCLIATYLVGVVQVHNTVLCRHVLVALALAAHDQRGVHVHVVASKVQADQTLEDHRVRRLRSRKEDEQASSSAAISDHVENGAEARGLLELARGHAVQRIEQAADGVEEAAAARVEGHEVEGAEG